MSPTCPTLLALRALAPTGNVPRLGGQEQRYQLLPQLSPRGFPGVGEPGEIGSEAAAPDGVCLAQECRVMGTGLFRALGGSGGAGRRDN